MEPFSELSVEQWPELQKKLKQLWPFNMVSYYALQMNGNCRQIRDLFEFRVFVPYGDMDNGCIITRQPIQDRSYRVFNVNPVTKDTSKLEEALRKTKLIDWTPNNIIDFVPSYLNQVIVNLLNTLPQTYEYKRHSLILYFKDSKEAPFLDLRCPSDTYVAPVRTEHIQRIDDVWRHKFSGSDLFFTTLASNNLGYGLFSCNNHELLAWLFIGDYWHLCHLYCERSTEITDECDFGIGQILSNSKNSQRVDSQTSWIEIVCFIKNVIKFGTQTVLAWIVQKAILTFHSWYLSFLI